MKIILTLSIFLICFLQLGQSVIDQNEVMSDLLFNLYGYDKSLDPCDSNYVKCRDINSTSTFQTFISLYLSKPSQEYVITQDLTTLQNLTSLHHLFIIILINSLNLNQYDIIFPASLEIFVFNKPSAPLSRAIFEPPIKYLYVYSPLIGYSIPTLIRF
ncbi:hypothetical protein ACTFIY_001298 [Dictyostelium cf. discoideum]